MNGIIEVAECPWCKTGAPVSVIDGRFGVCSECVDDYQNETMPDEMGQE